MTTKNQMCVYPIAEAPYLAISNVFKMTRKNQCLVEDTKGRLKRVRPVYVGPFDTDKLLQFGAMVSKYFSDMNDFQKNTTRLFNMAKA